MTVTAETISETGLLQQIAAISDDAFIAWERMVDVHPDVLTRTDGTNWCIYEDCFDDDSTRQKRPYLSSGGWLLAVFVEELGAWFPRHSGEDDYRYMEDRARAALYNARLHKHDEGGGEMRGCKHENADHVMPGEHWHSQDGWGASVAQCEQFRCLDCGAWLSLGAANDTPEVLVEIRAAEIAANVDGLPRDCDAEVFMTNWEFGGYMICANEPSPWAPISGDATAGYLARCIATHKDQP